MGNFARCHDVAFVDSVSLVDMCFICLLKAFLSFWPSISE